MTEIEWGEPSPLAHIVGSGAKPGRYKAIAAACKENPGKWARLPGQWKSKTSALSTANNIRAGKVTGFDKGLYEVAVEAGDDVKVWVRWPEGQVEGAEPAERRTAPVKAVPSPSEVASLEARRIREWAKANEYEVGDAGRLPRSIIEAYHRAMEERRRINAEAAGALAVHSEP